MNIIRARLKDAEAIARVEMTSGYPHDKNFDALRHARTLLHDKQEHVFVAKEKGDIVGYISLRKKGTIGELGFLAVMKRFQKKGTGTRLARFMLTCGKSIHCKKITLSVRNTNRRAIRLYKKFGFKLVRTVRKQKLTKLEMEKCL